MDSGTAAMADIGDSDAAAGDAGSELEVSFVSGAAAVAVGGTTAMGGAGACDSAEGAGCDGALSFDSATVADCGTAVVTGMTVGGLAAGRDGSERAVFLESFDPGAAATVEVGGFAAARDGRSSRSAFLDSDAAVIAAGAAGPLAAVLDAASERAAGVAARGSGTVRIGTGSRAGPRLFATVGSTTQWNPTAQTA